MSINTSASHKLLRRATEDNLNANVQIKSETNIKKASTFPMYQPIDIQLYSLNKEAYDSNPFLKARVKAYLNDLNKSCSNAFTKR